MQVKQSRNTHQFRAKVKTESVWKNPNSETCSAVSPSDSLSLDHLESVARLYHLDSRPSIPVLMSNHVFDRSDWANAFTSLSSTWRDWRRCNAPYERGLPCPRCLQSTVTRAARKEPSSGIDSRPKRRMSPMVRISRGTCPAQERKTPRSSKAGGRS